MNINFKKLSYALFILINFSVIAENKDTTTENDISTNITRSFCKKNCCNNSAKKGPRGFRGDSAFTPAFAYFFADPGQGPLTQTTPLDFSNFIIEPVRLKLTPPNEEEQSTGVIIQDSGTYFVAYKATWEADQTNVETVASIALTLQKSGKGDVLVIETSNETFVERPSKVETGKRYTLGSSRIITLNSGDIIGLQCPSLKNFSFTALSNKAVTFTIQRIA